ncbi:3-oxoacyl-[acyl-carrier protein] reductase [Ligilactobacillus sp. WC1T17]|uniref:3-oxoacyl-[acyl-carrier protein] reductase n=1 Tax=Ligilactobacillus ruminis TaxID=1623 RepID=A0ABY1A8R8_9LACO|nr:3-oxoacyl-[acyl-carrier protein] reductase [Ligilactobacillus ruminis]
MEKYFDYQAQKVVITGVASGIGLAQAQAFLAAGAVVCASDIQQNNAVSQLQHQYPQTFYFTQGDLASLAGIQNLADLVAAKMGFCNILLNTAGILDAYTPTLETSEALWDKVFNTNLKSIFRLTNLLLPKMLENGHGVVINMASIAGLVAGGGGAAYTASKHAIIGYTKQLDLDYAAQGIRACAIAPGAINTPMNKKDFEGDAKMAKEVASLTPAKRWASPKEVADLTLFLASSAADYIHGATVPIDGGWIEK